MDAPAATDIFAYELFFIPSKSEPNKMEVNVCLINISGDPMCYRFKKQKEASIRILPEIDSHGHIWRHSNKMITFVWTDATPSNPSVKLLMRLSLNSEYFGEIRLVGRVAEQPQGFYNPNKSPFALLIDAPRPPAGLVSPIISAQFSSGSATRSNGRELELQQQEANPDDGGGEQQQQKTEGDSGGGRQTAGEQRGRRWRRGAERGSDEEDCYADEPEIWYPDEDGFGRYMK